MTRPTFKQPVNTQASSKFKRHVYKLDLKSDTSPLKLFDRSHLHALSPTMSCDAMGQKQIIGVRN